MAVALGRSSGFIRDALLGYYFGTTLRSDIIITALMVPDFVINLISSGGMSLILIPYLKNSKDVSSDTRYFLIIFVTFGLIVSFILLLFQDFIAGYYFDFNNHSHFEFKSLMIYTVFTIPFALSSIIFISLLQVRNKFFISQISPLIVNICLSLGIISCFHNNFNVNYIGYALIIAYISRFIIQYYCCNINFENILPKKYYINYNIVEKFVLATVIYSIIILVPFVIKSKAIFISEGSLSIFNYSYRFVDFALVITTSLALIIYPKISEKNTSNQEFSICFQLIFVSSILLSIFFGLAILLLKFFFININNLDFDIHKLFKLCQMILPIIVLQTLAIFMIQNLYLKGCIKFCSYVSIFAFIVFIIIINVIELNSANLITLNLIFMMFLNIIFTFKSFSINLIINRVFFSDSVKLLFYFIFTYFLVLIYENLIMLIIFQIFILFLTTKISLKYLKR